MTFLRNGLFGGIVGAMGDLVFEWNRTDLSQFNGASPIYDSGGGAENSLMSVVAASERGNVLRLAADGVATDMFAVWRIATPIEFSNIRRDLFIEMTFADKTLGGGSRRVGPVWFGNADMDHHFGVLFDQTNDVGIVENNGTTETGPTNASVQSRGGRHTFLIRGDKPAGGPPRGTVYYTYQSSGGALRYLRRSGSTAAIRGNAPDQGSNSSLGSTWNSLDCDYVGLRIGSIGGVVGPTSVDIDDLRIYRVSP